MEMAYIPSLSYRQVLGQKQVYSLKLLAMDGCELEKFLYEAQLENPFIQMPERSENAKDCRITTLDYYERPFRGREGFAEEEWDEEPAARRKAPGDKQEFFRMQLSGRLSAAEEQIFCYMIMVMDSRGYISVEDAEMAENLRVEPEEVKRIRALIQSLEPAGVGARNLQECLCLQLERKGGKTGLCESIVRNDLPDVASGKYQKIASRYGVTKQTVLRELERIRALNPIPLNGYGEDESQYIVPDIIVEREKQEWFIRLNTGNEGIRISEEYSELMRKYRDEDTIRYCREKWRDARFLQKCLEQRKQTLLKIAGCFLAQQQDFCAGRAPLKPMKMKELAAAAGMHESTVSRAVRDKYMQLPAGVFRMRDLFEQSFGEDAAGESEIKEDIRRWIAGEDRRKPISDQQIAELFCKKGISISRRTVAKYREELHISSSRVRRCES